MEWAIVCERLKVEAKHLRNLGGLAVLCFRPSVIDCCYLIWLS